MTPGAFLFAACSVICVVGALVTILAQNPIRGAMGLLATIAGIAGLFLALEAQFLAAIQLIVYAGAVVVLFVFVIMLLGPTAGAGRIGEEPRARYAPWFSSVLFLGVMGFAMVLVGGANTTLTAFAPSELGYGSIEAFGKLLYSDGMVPFELTTALLIVAIVGAIAVARTAPRKKPVRRIKSATRRMFGGPVEARDAARDTPRLGALPSQINEKEST